MMIDEGGNSAAEAARRAAEEAARRAAEEEAARLRAEEAQRALEEQRAGERMQDRMEPPPPVNRIFQDEINAAQAEASAETYRVDPSGNLVPAPATPPAEYAVALEAHGQASAKVDAQITAAFDDQGPGSREAAMLRSQRDRLIQADTQAAVLDFRDGRDAAALCETYAAEPERWADAAQQMGLDPTAPPDAAAIKDFLGFDRKLDQQAALAAQIATNGLPPSASAEDRQVAAATAAAQTRLEALVEKGVVKPPDGADVKAWTESRVQMAGEVARVQVQATAAGLDPQHAVATSDRLFSLQLDDAVRSGAVDLSGASPEQVAEWKEREVSRFREAATLADARGLDMAEAQRRVADAYSVQDRRIAAQQQINGMADEYNQTTTAVERGGERILSALGGDGIRNMDWARDEVGQIEALEREYQQKVLYAEGAPTDADRQGLAHLEAEIDGRLDAVMARAGLDAQVSAERAGAMGYVETGLFAVVYTASAALGPLGLVTGGVTKAFLQDLPNGRIRNDGDALATMGDLGLSVAMGVGEVALNRLPGAQGWSGAAVNMAANGGFGVASDVAYQLRDDREGVDWREAALAGAASAGGSLLGDAASLPVGRMAAETASAYERQVFKGAVGFSSASVVDAATQFATTGNVDFARSMEAGGHGIVGALASVPGPEAPRPSVAPVAEPIRPLAPERDDLVILGDRRPRLDAMVAGEGPVPALGGGATRVFPPEANMPPGVEQAMLDVMKDLGIREVSVRASAEGAPAWYGVGGADHLEPGSPWINVRNPPAPAAEPIAMDGKRPIFPASPIDGGTGALYPTKPSSAKNLEWQHVVSLNEARAAKGLPSLQEAFPSMPLPVAVGEIDGQPVVAQQGMLGNAKPVLINWKTDEAGRVVEGDVVTVVSDIDLVDVVGHDGVPWDFAQVRDVFNPALNRAYSKALGLPVEATPAGATPPTYDVVNHAAHGVFDDTLRAKFQLDKPEYWNNPAYTLTASGDVTWRPLGDRMKDVHDRPDFVPAPYPAPAPSRGFERLDRLFPDGTRGRQGLEANTPELFRRFAQAASEPGTTSWNAVLRAVGGEPVEGKGSNVLAELERLGYEVAETPRPGDVALFVEDLPLEDGRLSNVRHAAFVSGVGPEMTFLSADLTRATTTSQTREATGEYSLAAMTAQDQALDRAQIFYLRRPDEGGAASMPAEAEAPRLLNPEGRPLSLRGAGESLAGLLTDPRSPLLLQSALDPEAPARSLASAARDFHESYYAVYYNPDTGSVRAAQVASGDHGGAEVLAEDIEAEARLGEVPIAGFHNHAPQNVAPTVTRDRRGEGALFELMRSRYGVEFKSFIARVDQGRTVLTDFSQ